MNNKSILIVDDELELLTMIKTTFECAVYTQILSVSSAKEALKILSTKIPNIIILDVMMPNMNGFELLQEIRSISKVPVLMLTARGNPEDRFTGFELGADDYLIKPFLKKELLLRVAAILKRTYPEDNRIVILDAATIDLDKAEVLR